MIDRSWIEDCKSMIEYYKMKKLILYCIYFAENGSSYCPQNIEDSEHSQ